jgi:hypothetical protein
MGERFGFVSDVLQWGQYGADRVGTGESMAGRGFCGWDRACSAKKYTAELIVHVTTEGMSTGALEHGWTLPQGGSREYGRAGGHTMQQTVERYGSVRPVILMAVCNIFGLAVLQVVPLQPDWIASAGQLTLSAALVIAVGVLWKALVKKDDALVQSTKIVTEALTSTAAANAELRHVIEQNVQVKERLVASIDLLQVSIGSLPCTEGAEHKRGT